MKVWIYHTNGKKDLKVESFENVRNIAWEYHYIDKSFWLYMFFLDNDSKELKFDPKRDIFFVENENNKK